jgi:YQGE family putative transporter
MFDLFFSYVYRFLHRYLGVKRPLSDKEKTLAWMFSLYDFNYALSAIFVNVFLFRKSENFHAVGLFNLTQFAVIAPAFWMGGHLSKRFGNLLSYQLGFVFSALVFAATLILRENATNHPCFLGLLAGLGIGFYFLGEHSLTLEMTTEETRDYFLSVTTFFSSVLCILGPALAGWVITAFGTPGSKLTEDSSSLLGYYFVFAMALALYLVLTYKSFQFHSKPTHKGFYFWKTLTFKNNGDWNRLMGAQFILGLRGGIFWFVVGLLVFRVSHNEAVVGSYSMLANFLAVLTSYGLSLWAKAENRWKGLWNSSWLMGLACVGLFFKINYLTLFTYAVLNASGGTWGQIVYGAFSFRILEKARDAQSKRIEYLAVREFPLALGRCMGLSALLAGHAYFGETGLRAALLLFGFVHMGVFLFLPRNKGGEILSAQLEKA